MALFGGGRIHADPKTPSQLRAALAAAQAQDDTLGAEIDAVEADVAALEVRVDAIEAQSGPVSATFVSAAAIGQPVYVVNGTSVDLADADAVGTAPVVGLVSTAAGAGATGAYITAGRLSQADWTTVIGASALTAGSVYYLSGTTGQLTTTAPGTGTVVRVGRALTTTTFLIAIEPGIRR